MVLVPLHQLNLLQPPGLPLPGQPVAKTGDSAGGTLTGTIATHVKINGAVVIVVGDPVASHGSGSHGGATMVAGSAVVFANGIPLVRTGDAASCGHPAAGTSHVFAS